jgi:Na+-driven multidrug efflux pump
MQHGPDIAPAVGVMFLMFAVFVGLIVTAITILAFCKIFSKAGYCWAFGLLALVPFGVLVMVLILAFADWPIHRELRTLKPQTLGT